MSVPCSDTETRSASFWSFNHCLLSFTLSSLACWLFHLLFFLLQNAVLCFIIHCRISQGSLVTSWLHFACSQSHKENGMVPSGGDTICTLFIRLIHNLYCVLCVFGMLFFAMKGVSMLSEIEGWVMRDTNAPCLYQSSICCSSVSGPGRLLNDG